MVTFALYALASLGLALNCTSYAALLAFRALQSLGASTVLAVAYSVVAHLCLPTERSRMLGAVMAASNFGPCVGPVPGGWVANASSGLPWVFGGWWSLARCPGPLSYLRCLRRAGAWCVMLVG